MKRILWAAAVAAAVWGLPRLSHPAVDIGKLEPVEAVLLTAEGNEIIMETDTGAKGVGNTLEEAVADLREKSDAEVYLDTANKLLLKGNMERYWPEIVDRFRPSCRVCTVEGQVDLEMAAKYLSVHKPELTLNQWRSGERQLQKLIMEEGRGWLVSE